MMCLSLIQRFSSPADRFLVDGTAACGLQAAPKRANRTYTQGQDSLSTGQDLFTPNLTWLAQIHKGSIYFILTELAVCVVSKQLSHSSSSRRARPEPLSQYLPSSYRDHRVGPKESRTGTEPGQAKITLAQEHQIPHVTIHTTNL